MFDVRFSMQLFRRNILSRITALILAGIFIYAGVIKIMDPIGFARDLDNYHMLPWAISVRLAFYLPWLEVFCGLAVLCGFFYRGALLLLNALIFIFAIAAVTAKVRGLDITCGCFGHASKNWSFSNHLILDLALLVAAAFLWFSSRRESFSTPADRPLSPQDSVGRQQKL